MSQSKLQAESRTVGVGKQARQVTVITGPPRPPTVEEQLDELRRRIEALEQSAQPIKPSR